MLRIWLEVSHHAAFRVGGWAFVCAQAGGPSLTISGGQAGGERRMADAERAALAGLLAALKGLQGPATVATGSSSVAALPARLAAFAAGDAEPAAGDLALWAQAKTVLGGGTVRVVRAPANPFCASWAELARDRAKDKGDFAAPIPKPNLAKAGVA